MAITRDMWIVLRARDEASRIVRSFSQNVSSAANSAANNVNNFQNRMREVGQTLNQFALTSMLAGTAMAGFGAAGLMFIKETTKVAVEYDNQVRRTLTQVDDITISLKDLAEIGRRVAREVEIPFEQMQETLFFIFSSMNVNLAQSEKLLKGFAKEAVAGQTTIEAAARSNIAIINALGMTVDDLTRIQNVQFQVVRKGIITYEELANTIGRVLPAAARSGQSIETVGAMMAFLTRNGLSAAMAAASAARALESFAHPKTVERLEQIGIKVRDAKGEFLPLVDVMTQMNKILSKMSTPERAKFFQELFKGAGGTIQARRFWDTAFKNFGDFQEMMGFMANSAGVFENAYETMANSVANKTVLLENKWKVIQEALGRAVIPHLLMLMTQLGKLLDWFERLPEPTKNLIGQIILFGSVLSIVVGILVIFVGTIAFFVSGIMMAGPALAGIIAAVLALTVGIIGLGAAFYAAYDKSRNFRLLIASIVTTLKGLWETVVATAKTLKEVYDNTLGPSLQRLAEIIAREIVPRVTQFIYMLRDELVPKIQEAGRIIADRLGWAMEYAANVINTIIIPALKQFSAWWDANKGVLYPYITVLAQVVKWLLIIAAAIVAIGIISFITGIVLLISTIYSWISALKAVWYFAVKAFDIIASYYEFWGKVIKDAFNATVKGAKDAWNDIKNFFTSAKDFLVNAGKDIINGLINGIKSGIEGLKNVLRGISDMIPKVKGPKAADLKLLQPVGQYIMQGLMTGISSQVPLLREQLQGITNQINQLPAPTMNIPTQANSVESGQTNVTQNITVNTQEIDPRIHAMELGWELGNRL